MRDWQQLIEDHEVEREEEEESSRHGDEMAELPADNDTRAVVEDEGERRPKQRLHRRGFKEFLSRASEIRQRHRRPGQNSEASK